MKLDFKQLDALAAVLRTGSFEAAADELCLTSSALSQRIRQLESRIGAVLIVRSKPCVATPEGNRVHRYAQEMALQEREMLSKLTAPADNNLVPVSIALNPDSMVTWFLSALDGVPGFLYSLKIDNSEFGAGMLKRGDVVAAVTFGEQKIQGCDSYTLGTVRYLPVARQDFIDKWFADGLTIEAFRHAPALTFNRHDRLQIRLVEMITGQNSTPPTHLMADARALGEAAAAGLGWVMLPHMLAEPLLADNCVVTLSDKYFIDSKLNWQVSRASRQMLSPLTSSVRQTAGQWLKEDEF